MSMHILRTAVSAAYSLCYSMCVASAQLNRTARTISLAMTKFCFSLLLAHLGCYLFVVRVSLLISVGKIHFIQCPLSNIA